MVHATRERAEKAIPAAFASTGQRVWTARRGIGTDRRKRLRGEQKAVNQGRKQKVLLGDRNGSESRRIVNSVQRGTSPSNLEGW